MASIHLDVTVEVSTRKAWEALREVGRAHELFAPVLVGGSLEGDTRTVTFANGMVVRERILDVDDVHRRVAYTVLDGPGMSYHHASMQLFEAGPERSRFVWITDVLPEDAREAVVPLVEQGSRALKANLEGAAPR